MLEKELIHNNRQLTIIFITFYNRYKYAKILILFIFPLPMFFPFYTLQQFQNTFLKCQSRSKVLFHVRAYIQLISEPEDGLQVPRITYKSVGRDLLVLISYESWDLLFGTLLRAVNAERKVFGFSDDSDCEFKLNEIFTI